MFFEELTMTHDLYQMWLMIRFYLPLWSAAIHFKVQRHFNGVESVPWIYQVSVLITSSYHLQDDQPSPSTSGHSHSNSSLKRRRRRIFHPGRSKNENHPIISLWAPAWQWSHHWNIIITVDGIIYSLRHRWLDQTRFRISIVHCVPISPEESATSCQRTNPWSK